MIASFGDAHLLSWVIFLPLATAALLLFVSSSTAVLLGNKGLPVSVWRPIALGGSVLTFGLAVFGLWRRFDPEQTGYQLIERFSWLPRYGVHYFVGIDGISLVLVLFTAFLIPLVLLGGSPDTERSRSYLFFMLSLETAMLGAFSSLNLFQFYIFWEAALLPVYFLIGVFGGPRRIHAATKFFVSTLAGSLLLLSAMIVVYWINFEQGGALNFDWVAAPLTPGSGPVAPGIPLLETWIPRAGAPDYHWWQTEPWLFGAFALGFAMLLPVVPLHGWLPDAQVEAPIGGSMVLAGVLQKLAGYGMLRFALPLFPIAAETFAPVFFALALAGILYGSLLAMVQRDLKKVVAYASIAYLGFVLLGLFAQNLQGVTGAVLHMLNHGLFTGGLLVLIGFLYRRRKTREIADFGGLARPIPIFASFFVLIVMAGIGVPALNGFVGEFLILLGTFGVSPWSASIATLGAVFLAAGMLSVMRRVVFGPLDKPENRGLIDLDWRERAVAIAFCVPIIWIGVHPDPLLRRIEPSVSVLLQDMELRKKRSLEIDAQRLVRIDSLEQRLEQTPLARAEPVE